MDSQFPDNRLVEPLFLDLTIEGVLNRDAGMLVKEPWASMYVSAIRDGRYGDAVWARYHISGDVVNGRIGGTNKTVIQMIAEDAREYRVDDPNDFDEALSFYAGSSSTDGHPDVIQVLRNVAKRDLAQLKAQMDEYNRSHEFQPGHPPA
ncbi:hypothetical protein N7456_006508 [Penicillium angulare]|uniref:Uncharacterized protein n=1 Tax=Penicillium angulare TaxID=116970 RepID=A0A9W9KC95_9EURO|nr:hypothetical protein N7456_006508 [Penicillium angulare]